MPAGKTYVKIASQTLGSAAATITFNNIPQNYTDLVVAMNGTCSTGDYNLLQFNSDSGSNYSHTEFYGDASVASYGRGSGRTTMYIGRGNTSSDVKTLNIMNYSNGSTYKTMIYRNNSDSIGVFSGLWKSTASITSLTFSRGAGNYNSGYSITIYGIEAAKSPKAEGGDKIYSDGTYWIHQFNYSGTFVPRTNLTCDYLVVAGGGGGASDQAGGGGAGGLRSTVTATGGGGSLESALSLTAGNGYTITVGAGGIGGIYPNAGSQGSNSSISGTGITTVTSTGGGYGSQYVTVGGSYPGGSGGSGGGSSGRTIGGGGTRTTNQGYNGGNGYWNGAGGNSGRGGGGGGGGAGAAGSNATNSNGANGGNGVAVSISGSSVTYAGGGGGGADESATKGSGGTGGGGNGGGYNTSPPTSGTVNLGAGGGGGGYGSGGGTAGSGGSGIVIVRYAV